MTNRDEVLARYRETIEKLPELVQGLRDRLPPPKPRTGCTARGEQHSHHELVRGVYQVGNYGWVCVEHVGEVLASVAGNYPDGAVLVYVAEEVRA